MVVNPKVLCLLAALVCEVIASLELINVKVRPGFMTLGFAFVIASALVP